MRYVFYGDGYSNKQMIGRSFWKDWGIWCLFNKKSVWFGDIL